jgi:hypothetical protein
MAGEMPLRAVARRSANHLAAMYVNGNGVAPMNRIRSNSKASASRSLGGVRPDAGISVDAQQDMPRARIAATALESRADSSAESFLDAALACTFPASDPLAVDYAFTAAMRRERAGSDDV